MPNQKLLLFLILLTLLTPSHALQQTSGALTINLTQGEQSVTKYGLRNEANESVTVKLSANGSIENYIDYPKQLTLEPQEFRYINITATIPSNYTGSKELNGTIYALKEGESGGQVQINIRLGKRITINITDIPEQVTMTKDERVLMKVSLIAIVIVVVAVILKNKTKEYEFNKEVEKK